MASKLCKWGHSIGLRVPQHVAQQASLRVGDYVSVRLLDCGDIVIRPVKERDIHVGYATDETPSTIKNKAPAAEEKW